MMTILARAAAAAAAGIGLSLAMAMPAQAATTVTPDTADPNTFVIASHPSQHCWYYHHYVNGHPRGDAYGCTANASVTTYRAWVVCHDDIDNVDRKIYGPVQPKPYLSIADCDARSSPKVGGFDS